MNIFDILESLSEVGESFKEISNNPNENTGNPFAASKHANNSDVTRTKVSKSKDNAHQDKIKKHVKVEEKVFKSSPEDPYAQVNTDVLENLLIKIDRENVLSGIIFSELLGKPRALRRIR